MKLIKWLAMSTILAFSANTYADVVNNGGFEIGGFSGWTQSGAADAVSVANDHPHTGTHYAAFGSETEAYLEQSLTTVAGQAYSLDFWLASGQQNGSTAGSYFKAEAGGVTLFEIDSRGVFDPNFPNAFPYTAFSGLFTATAASTTLKFTLQHETDYFFLDDISVTAVPLPAAFWLFVSGIGGISVIGRRRNKA